MEISNEIKSKMFAQYLGQEVRRDNYTTIQEKLTVPVLEYISDFIIWDTCKLILRPLSAITNEDAIEVANIMASPHIAMRLEKDETKIKDCKYWIENGLIATFTNNSYKHFAAYQYLQSRGYDLPQYLLDGKTLFETGMAIYEN